MPEDAIIAKKGRYGGTYAHPFVAIEYMINMDQRVLLWLMEIASENSSPAELCNRLIEKLKLDPPQTTGDCAIYLYLIRKVKTNHYKIGISKNPEERKASLQTANPERLELVAYCYHENAYEVEQSIHTMLNEKHIYGEWFDLDAELLVYILREYYGATI